MTVTEKSVEIYVPQFVMAGTN